MKPWIIASAALLVAAANPADPAPAGGTQVERGDAVYAERCASCHGASMQGFDVAPPLHSQTFLSAWQGKSVVELTRRIRSTMPMDAPGTLDAAQTAAVTAAILHANDLKFGTAEIPEASADQKALVIAP